MFFLSPASHGTVSCLPSPSGQEAVLHSLQEERTALGLPNTSSCKIQNSTKGLGSLPEPHYPLSPVPISGSLFCPIAVGRMHAYMPVCHPCPPQLTSFNQLPLCQALRYSGAQDPPFLGSGDEHVSRHRSTGEAGKGHRRPSTLTPTQSNEIRVPGALLCRL